MYVLNFVRNKYNKHNSLTINNNFFNDCKLTVNYHSNLAIENDNIVNNGANTSEIVWSVGMNKQLQQAPQASTRKEMENSVKQDRNGNMMDNKTDMYNQNHNQNTNMELQELVHSRKELDFQTYDYLFAFSSLCCQCFQKHENSQGFIFKVVLQLSVLKLFLSFDVIVIFQVRF